MVTRKSPIELELYGKTDELDLRALSHAIENLAKLVGDLPSQEGRVKLGGLREGSAVIGVQTTPIVAREIEHGLKELRASRRRPDGWTLAQLEAVKGLINNGRRGDGASLVVNGAEPRLYELNLEMAAAVAEAVERSRTSIGSVRGRIDRYNGHGQPPTAKLVHERTGKSITLRLAGNLTDQVLDAMHDRVEVSGRLVRNPETNEVEEVDARSLRKLPDAPKSGRGIWSGMKLDGSIERIIRESREA